MKNLNDQSNKINKSSEEIIAEYILDQDVEKDDYIDHCIENKLMPFDLRKRSLPEQIKVMVQK